MQNTIFTVVMTIMIIANTINMGGQLDLVLFLMFACLKFAPREFEYIELFEAIFLSYIQTALLLTM